MRKIYLSPSILTCPKEKVSEQLKIVSSEADYLHFDVMDGIFVPKKTFDYEYLKYVSKFHSLLNDVHLMVVNPIDMVEQYVKNGADIITFHYEAYDNREDILKCIERIHDNGCKAGISIKPLTSEEDIFDILQYVDLVLVMSVEPGKGGQKFLDGSAEKIAKLRKYIDDNNLKTLIEVDGGINEETFNLVAKAGVDIVVAGSYIFDSIDPLARIRSLKKWA